MVQLGPTEAATCSPLSPPSVSLLRSARVIEKTDDDRWINGWTCLPEGCGAGGVIATCPDPGTTMNFTTIDAFPLLKPYYVYSADKCSAAGSWSSRDFAARATRKLLACESKLIEGELWTGAVAGNPAIASSAATSVTTSAVSPVVALMSLEEALADCSCGSVNMIHMRPYELGFLVENNILRREGNTWMTPMDNIVVPGRGYTGSSPTGAPASPTSAWMYATGMVTIMHSPVRVIPDGMHEALNRSLNDITFFAERAALAFWDSTCCHLAAQVSREMSPIGSSSSSGQGSGSGSGSVHASGTGTGDGIGDGTGTGSVE